MRINEIMLNEGWYDDAKSAVANKVNQVKQSPVGQKIGYHAGELGKVGSDIGHAASGVGDWAKSALYKTTGIGGDPANAAATRLKFIDDFKQELDLSQRSARNAGQQYDNGTFVNQYIKRYGWTLDPEELSQVMMVKDDPKKLANAMYNVAVGQRKGTGQYASTPSLGAQQNTGSEQRDISTQTQQMMGRIQKMTGSSNFDDLSAVAKTAMQALYQQNPGEYTKLYREIVGLGTNKADQL